MNLELCLGLKQHVIMTNRSVQSCHPFTPSTTSNHIVPSEGTAILSVEPLTLMSSLRLIRHLSGVRNPQFNFAFKF